MSYNLTTIAQVTQHKALTCTKCSHEHNSTSVTRTGAEVYRFKSELFRLAALTWSLCSIRNPRRLRYLTSVQLSLLGLIGLNVDFSIFLNQRGFIPNIRLQRFLFSIKVITSAERQSMVACKVGDAEQVRALLCRQPLSVRYTTTCGATPLSIAIEYGNVDICRLLLDNGAELNLSFGLYQTSALSWAIKHRRMDIARLLVERNSSLEHLNVWCWSPIFYLWPETHRHASSKPFLNLLRSLGDFEYAHQGVVDVEGYSILARCALYGTPDDVLTLIKYGVDPFERENYYQWTVLHHVIYFGVEDVFLALFRMFEDQFGVEIPDVRGWTLLH